MDEGPAAFDVERGAVFLTLMTGVVVPASCLARQRAFCLSLSLRFEASCNSPALSPETTGETGWSFVPRLPLSNVCLHTMSCAAHICLGRGSPPHADSLRYAPQLAGTQFALLKSETKLAVTRRS